MHINLNMCVVWPAVFRLGAVIADYAWPVIGDGKQVNRICTHKAEREHTCVLGQYFPLTFRLVCKELAKNINLQRPLTSRLLLWHFEAFKQVRR